MTSRRIIEKGLKLGVTKLVGRDDLAARWCVYDFGFKKFQGKVAGSENVRAWVARYKCLSSYRLVISVQSRDLQNVRNLRQ